MIFKNLFGSFINLMMKIFFLNEQVSLCLKAENINFISINDLEKVVVLFI